MPTQKSTVGSKASVASAKTKTAPKSATKSKAKPSARASRGGAKVAVPKAKAKPKATPKPRTSKPSRTAKTARSTQSGAAHRAGSKGRAQVSSTAQESHGMFSGYMENLKGQLKDWGIEIDTLTARAEKLGADARAEFMRQADHLRSKQKDMAKKLQDLARATGPAWDDLAKGVEKAMRDIKSSMQEDNSSRSK